MAKIFYESELKELAGKKFNTEEEVNEAEAKVSAAIAKKQELAAAKKAEADVVSDAIKKLVEVKASAKEAKTNAYKEYLRIVDEENKKVEEAETAKNKALNDFCDKHPEGFHETIKIGNTETRYDYTKYSNDLTSALDSFTRLLSWF